MITLIAAIFLSVILVMISWIDLRKLIIPDAANAVLMAGGILYIFATEAADVPQYVMASLLTAGLALIFRVTFKKLRGVTGLGMGDIKFLAAAASWVGLWNMPFMMLVSCMFALTYVVLRSGFGNPVGHSERIPFGPYLCIGLGTTWGMNAVFEHWSLFEI